MCYGVRMVRLFALLIFLVGNEFAYSKIPTPPRKFFSRSVEYREYAPPEIVDRIRPQGTMAMAAHIEENHFFHTSKGRLMMRHAEAAAFSLFYGASEVSGKDVPVHAWDINPFVGGLMKSGDQSLDRSIMQYILDHATAMSLSMNTDPGYRMEIQSENVDELFGQWKSSRAIVTQSVGNGGAYCRHRNPIIIGQQELIFQQLADTYAKVGAATWNWKNGRVEIKSASSCSSPDFVAMNPYREGLRYRFRPTVSEFMELYDFYGHHLTGKTSNHNPPPFWLTELEQKGYTMEWTPKDIRLAWREIPSSPRGLRVGLRGSRNCALP